MPYEQGYEQGEDLLEIHVELRSSDVSLNDLGGSDFSGGSVLNVEGAFFSAGESEAKSVRFNANWRPSAERVTRWTSPKAPLPSFLSTT